MSKKFTPEYIEKKGLLAYKFLRGSWSHGIGVEGKSDYDYGGVYIAPKDMFLGLRENYLEQVSDEKADVTYYEFGRWLELILKQNPTALESLFIDKKFVIGDIHPAVQEVLDHKYEFLSKECFKPLLGYSYNQIAKATGYNKKCHIPEDFQRKDVLDFCFVFKGQGSQPVREFLEQYNLLEKYCGLSKIPNMRDDYGLYYDFAAHFVNEKGDWGAHNQPYWKLPMNSEKRIVDRELAGDFYDYKGIANSNSNEVRLSSIPKGEMPIAYMSFNADGYSTHCREYREWEEWKKKRNQIRYDDNKGFSFDAKNMCETVRLIHTGIELARDGVFNVERTWDRDFLLDIKNHKVDYDTIMAYAKEKEALFNELVEKSSLPDTLDREEVNKILINARKKIYDI
jgi:hypothetical protein